MLLANEFVHDTRVYKEARSLIEWGCQVHVIATARHDLPAEEVHDQIHVHRIERRSSSLWRLAMGVLLWWCRPALGALFPPPAPEAAGPRHADEGPSRSVVSLKDRARWLPGPMRRILGPVVRRANLAAKPARRAFRRIGRLGRQMFRGVVRSLKRRYPASFRLLAFNVACVRRARTLSADVIQAHDLNTLAAGAILKRLHGIPLVYDSHELFLERNLGSRSRARDKIVWAPVERFCIGRCDAVLSVAEGICRHLQKQYGIPEPHLIRNVQPYEPPAPRSRILSDELGVDGETAIVLYPGAITINRGLEVMIDAAPHLSGAVFVIMGYARNPKYLASLKERAEALGELDRRVFFREAVPIDQVVRYTASADLGIVPTQNVCLSYYFESSNKIFHCLMAGVPLVMSDHAEKRLLAEEHEIGVLFDETDPADIARAVNETLADGQSYERMCANCLAAARSLNWEHEEHKLRTIFAELLGDRSRPVPPVSLPEQPEPVIETVRRNAVNRSP